MSIMFHILIPGNSKYTLVRITRAFLLFRVWCLNWVCGTRKSLVTVESVVFPVVWPRRCPRHPVTLCSNSAINHRYNYCMKFSIRRLCKSCTDLVRWISQTVFDKLFDDSHCWTGEKFGTYRLAFPQAATHILQNRITSD